MPSDRTIEQELAERARGGDPAAWRAIYDATCERLFSFLCYQVGDRDEARDILQETYIAAFAALGRFRGEAPLAVWLRSIALARAIDWKRVWLRRIKRTTRITEDSVSVEAATDDVRFEAEHRALHGALRRLSEHQRAALLLREWDDLSFKEIGGLLGCAESTARVHHTRARARMRATLERGELPAAEPSLGGQET